MSRKAYVSIDNFVVVHDEDGDMTEREIIEIAADQITRQLVVDIHAYTWIVEIEEVAR